jgi:hypothetical protein
VAALVAAGAVVVAVYGALVWWRDKEIRAESVRLLAWLRNSRSTRAA